MSEKATRLIAENRANKSTVLDLDADDDLDEIPPAIGELVWLEDLRISNTDVRTLATIRPLTRLRNLEIAYTRVADLKPLSGLRRLERLFAYKSAVADLTPLAVLTSLRDIDVSGTKVTDISPLAGLTALEELYLHSTSISDLSPLTGLTRLRILSAHATLIEDLTPLTNLTNLQILDVSTTRVADLSALANVRNPARLDVAKTMVSDLSPLHRLILEGHQVQWSTGSWEDKGIFVGDCPLTSPPPEIAKQGNNAILNYFREREAGAVDHLYEAKLLVVGEGGAGKTSLVRRLYRPGLPLPSERDTTKGIDIQRHEFNLKNNRRFRLNVWDFGGQEIYHATHQFFLTRRSLYCLVDDTRKDHKSVSDEGFKYWLELIDLFGGHSPVVIFQNEKGGRSKAIDIAGIKGQFDNVKEKYSGNLEHADSVVALREAVEFYATQLSHIGEALPARWIKIRADIEARAAEVPHITQQEYFEIYRRHLEFDRTRALHLSRYLHDLGVFLHFQDDQLLGRTVILQNQWATDAVFRILDDEQVKRQFGRFTSVDCARLWRDAAYEDMHPELLALMQQFELCYLLPDSRPQTWLAPQLLPPMRPDVLTEWSHSQDRDLVLRYVYDFLPKGVVSRLTVRLHHLVGDPGMAWATGVLLNRDDTAALVEVLPTGREIELRARGPERKAMLTIIAADLDALNESFQGLHDKVDKRIPCTCSTCLVAAVPEFFAQKSLKKRADDKKFKVECPRSYENVDVLELLDGLRVETVPDWAQPGTTRTIRIFLASSSELREDRDAFDLYFRQRNDVFRKRGFYIEIIRWETFLDAMSQTRLQDEYNNAIRACDVFVSLFFTKTGRFTEEEFDAAHRQFKATGKPLVYTFFKNADIKTASVRKEDLTSLWAFQERLKGLGHFWTTYDSVDQLKQKFRDQLDEVLESSTLNPGSLT